MSAIENVPDLFFAGALIYKRDENGDVVPTWRYRLEPFQRAVAKSHMTLSQIELRCGWVSPGNRGGRLSRVLGLRPTPGSRKRQPDGTLKQYPPAWALSLSYENAVSIARALDLDFVEWEL